MSTHSVNNAVAPTVAAKATMRPTIIYIFGGSGDLAQRKLIPALYNLFIDGYLPQPFLIVGVGRNTFTNTAYRMHLRKGVQEFSRRKADVKGAWPRFSQCVEYVKLDLMQDKTYKSIAGKIKRTETEWGTEATVIDYLSVVLQLAPAIAKKLYNAKLTAYADR